jgi:SnoaL-like protein
VASERLDWLQRLVDVWNAGDLDGFLEAIGSDVLFTPDPSFPDAGTYRGEELEQWLREWVETWEDNRLEVLDMDDRGEAATMRCRWHLAPREGQDEIPVDDFTLVWWFEDGDPIRPIRWSAFFDQERALQAARSGTG